MDFVKKYTEHGYINNVEVSMRVFESQFDKALHGKKPKEVGILTKRLIDGEKVKIGNKIFYYEERDVKTGEVKINKH